MGPSHDKQHSPHLLSSPHFLIFRLSSLFLALRLSPVPLKFSFVVPSFPSFPHVSSVPQFAISPVGAQFSLHPILLHYSLSTVGPTDLIMYYQFSQFDL